MPNADSVRAALVDAGWVGAVEVRERLVILTPGTMSPVSPSLRESLIGAAQRTGCTHVAIEIPTPDEHS